ncbi:MAG: uncharacterized protein A8A55_2734 [Amphiamblys sp. WSBS2006]|nr:MAG: uncharacterized protein A8A55_2734 [Amphiamblys sp. WSBS2006]
MWVRKREIKKLLVEETPITEDAPFLRAARVAAAGNKHGRDRADGKGRAPKRPRTAERAEAMTKLLRPKAKKTTVIKVSLPEAPLGEVRRNLEALGTKRGDIAQLERIDGHFWVAGDARGLAKIERALKAEKVKTEPAIEWPARLERSLEKRLASSGEGSKTRELLEEILRIRREERPAPPAG